MNSKTDTTSKYRIDFIDPLFAVAVHIGIVEGLLQEGWFGNWRAPTLEESVNILFFFLGFVVLALSWVGYHVSISQNEIKSDARFILDIVLLIFYIFLLVTYQDIGVFMGFMFGTFIVYVLWDYYKTREHVDKYYERRDSSKLDFCTYFRDCNTVLFKRSSESRVIRQSVTVFWAYVFFAIFLWSWTSITEHIWFEGTLLIVSASAIVLYRVEKTKARVCLSCFAQGLVGLGAVGALIFLAI